MGRVPAMRYLGLPGSLGVLALALASVSSPQVSRLASTRPLAEAGYARDTVYSVEDGALDALQDQFRPTLEANRKELLGQTGPVKGFGAGTIYPQIWLRDSATLIPATRYYYGREYLTSWIEEHLSHQRANGELYDWIAAGDAAPFLANAPRAGRIYRAGSILLSADKNTTATDQEASAVLAAGQAFALTGDRSWLSKKIVGRALVERLDAALEYVLAQRFSSAYGLVTTAFTADWGDVSPVYPDQRVIYLDARTPVVVGLYANALFAEAAEELGAMLGSLGDASRGRHWSGQASRIRTNIRRFLWAEGAGFYRMHRLLPGPGKDVAYDDTDTFALGGNALAALYGPADPPQAELIFAAAEERRRQNGGQWDWWAGRFLLAGFVRGNAGPASRQLREIARRVQEAGGLYEWYTREGKGRGSARYAGSAGALAGAVFAGLFGLDSRADGLSITVRLGAQPGAVRTYEPALDRYVVYRYSFEGPTRVARLRYESNAPGFGRLALLLPGGAVAQELLLDGRAAPFTGEAVGTDRYAVLRTDWRPHHLELRLR